MGTNNRRKKLVNGGAVNLTDLPQIVVAPPAGIVNQNVVPASSNAVNSNSGTSNQGTPVIIGPVFREASSETKVVSVGPVGVPETYESGKDPNDVPELGEIKTEIGISSAVVGAAGSGRKDKKQEMHFNPGEIRMHTPIDGLLFDFNDGARVKVPKGEYNVTFIDMERCATLFSANASDIIVMTTKKYFVPFRIEVRKDGGKEPVWVHEYNAAGKNVMLKYPTGAVIGDCLAWFPYAEEFRKKHGANVYVVMNPKMVEILKLGYPDLHFIPQTEEDERAGKWPEGLPQDIYATYYLGVFFPCDDRDHQPVDFRPIGLHTNAAMILGLDAREEHPPVLLPSDKEKKERTIKERYVCIAVNGSAQAKQWNNSRGWINVVRYLKKLGYRVLCIDREDFHQVGSYTNSIPFGCEDFTGDRPLQERIDLLYHADFFIGVSSGLSWMAWGVGIPVIVISGFTLPATEFYTPYRVINYHVCNGCWNDTRITFNHSDGEWCPRHKNTERQFECSRSITPEHVNKIIDRLMQDKGLVALEGKEAEK